MGCGLTHFPIVDMKRHPIDKWLKSFLKQIFFVVGSNSPYGLAEFLHILVTAALTKDFVNNTTVKLQPAPNSETVFNMLFECTNEKIEIAFNAIMASACKGIKIHLRSRKDKRKETWLTKELSKLSPKETKLYIKEDGYFHKNKTKNYVRTRFVIIKQYSYKDDTQPYDWVFATNRKLKSQMWYIRGYKCR